MIEGREQYAIAIAGVIVADLKRARVPDREISKALRL
jgi:hypothetical protein